MSNVFYEDRNFFKYFGISEDSIHDLEDKLRETHRFYHNTNHIEELLSIINKLDNGTLNESELRILKLVAYFHDAIYDPSSKTNEEDSKALMLDVCKSANEFCKQEIEEASKIILDTKTHEPSSKLSGIFCDLDLYGLKHGSIERVLEDERKIFLEFQRYDYSEYKNGRLAFLESYRKKIGNDKNVDALIGTLKFRRPRIGVYAGSFNPIHSGHLNIIKKAEKMFDKVIIAMGDNPDKQLSDVNIGLAKLHNTLPYRQVEYFRGFLTDYVREKSQHADIFIVRGLRNGKDLDYEVNQLRVMEGLNSFVKMMFIHCDKEYEHISSSTIRMMEKISKGSANHLLP
jgi:pantetheine-phosphate adenylyltransferase